MVATLTEPLQTADTGIRTPTKRRPNPPTLTRPQASELQPKTSASSANSNLLVLISKKGDPRVDQIKSYLRKQDIPDDKVVVATDDPQRLHLIFNQDLPRETQNVGILNLHQNGHLAVAIRDQLPRIFKEFKSKFENLFLGGIDIISTGSLVSPNIHRLWAVSNYFKRLDTERLQDECRNLANLITGQEDTTPPRRRVEFPDRLATIQSQGERTLTRKGAAKLRAKLEEFQRGPVKTATDLAAPFANTIFNTIGTNVESFVPFLNRVFNIKPQ